MERVIYKHVYNYLHQNRPIYEYQSGFFFPGHSTVHQLLEMYNSMLNSLENKEANCFVFCDFSKELDKVWHRGHLHQMKAYGKTGNLIDWLSSYIKGRRPKVVIKNNYSAYCESPWSSLIYYLFNERLVTRDGRTGLRNHFMSN
jgi:hypothetical protein